MEEKEIITEEKLSFWERIDDRVFDNTPHWLYIFYRWRLVYFFSGRFFRIEFKNYFIGLRYALIFRDRPFFNNEIRGLDWVLKNRILMGVKQFKKADRDGYPSDLAPEKWESTLDRMIYLLELEVSEYNLLWTPRHDDYDRMSECKRRSTMRKIGLEQKKLEKELWNLLGKYFGHLRD